MIVETSSSESIYECTKFCKNSTVYVKHTFTQPSSDQSENILFTTETLNSERKIAKTYKHQTNESSRSRELQEVGESGSSRGDTSQPIVTQLYSYFEIFCPAFKVFGGAPCLLLAVVSYLINDWGRAWAESRRGLVRARGLLPADSESKQGREGQQQVMSGPGGETHRMHGQ